MDKQILDHPLSREQLYQLRDDIRMTQEPFIQLLVDLYAVSLPKITIADGLVETIYSPDVEKKANEIRRDMLKAIEMVCRYKPNIIGRLITQEDLPSDPAVRAQAESRQTTCELGCNPCFQAALRRRYDDNTHAPSRVRRRIAGKPPQT